MLDLVNHISVSMQAKTNYVVYDDKQRVFSLIAGPDGVYEGSEVMLSYGEKCNARLLVDYGFAVAENDDNVIPDCS